jgi:hypothetical protein
MLSLVAGNALAAFEFTRATWDSNSALLAETRAQLGSERVKVWADINWSQLRPQDALLLVHPTHSLSVKDLNAFLRTGGRVALLDDFGAGGSLLENFQIRRVAAPSDPLEAFRNRPGLAIARREVPESESSPHPIVREVGQVVTNHATGLEAEPGVEWTPLLCIASHSRPPLTLAAVGVIGDAAACGLTEPQLPISGKCGRLFVMGDASVFIDLMLHFDGNRKLLQSLTSYLLEDDAWGPRGGTLYIATNDVGERGGNSDSEPFAQEFKRLSRAASGFVEELQSHGFSSDVCLWLACLAALLTASFALRATGRRHNPLPPRFVKAQSLLSQGGTAGRNALLSAATTTPDLVALELKSGAEKYLAAVLGCPVHAGAEEALRQLALRPEHAVYSSRIRALLGELARAESAVIQRNTGAFTENRLHVLAAQLDDQLQSFTHPH